MKFLPDTSSETVTLSSKPPIPSSILLQNELKLLLRILYKTKNQHHSAPFFRKLQMISRDIKVFQKIERSLQWGGKENKLSGKELQELFDSLVYLLGRLRESCKKAYVILEDIYSDGFFCLLTTTGMALVSRLSAVCLSIIEQELPLVKSELGITN